MTPPKETVQQTLAKSQAMLDQTKAQGSKAFAGSRFDVPAPTTPAVAPAITPSSLAPATPMTVAPAVPATQATGMMTEIADQTDQFTQNLAEQKKAAESPKTNALSDYIAQLKTAQGTAGLTADAYAEKGGVNEITPELNDINDKIRREQLALRRRVESIQKSGGGLAGGASAEIGNIERESFSKQADLAVIQQAIQGRYDSAKEIADRAVSAKLEKQTNDLAILKFNYEENKEAFTKAEQREFEALAGNRERKLQQDAENAKSIYELGIQASTDGAPTSVVERMLKAKTREEALALGGSYIGALDREAKQANIAQSYASTRASNLAAQKTQAELNAINSTTTGGSNIAVQALDSFSGTLNQNNREQYTKALTGAVKRGSVEQTEIALKNAAQAAAGSAMREDVIKRDQAIGALKNVQKELAAYEKAGGNTNLLTGGYEDLQNKLGKTSDPKLASIETRINLALNAYTNAVSGASFTPQESARYAALFPSTSNTNQLNSTKIDTLVDSFEGNNQVFYGNFYGGYTPSQLAEQAVYEELVANASTEQLKELGITQ